MIEKGTLMIEEATSKGEEMMATASETTAMMNRTALTIRNAPGLRIVARDWDWMLGVRPRCSNRLAH